VEKPFLTKSANPDMASEWELEYSPQFQKRVDRIKDKHVVKKIFEEAESLVDNPYREKLLQGKPRQYGIRSSRFGTRYGEMRLLYKLIEEEKKIYVVYVGTREEIYDLLNRWV